MLKKKLVITRNRALRRIRRKQNFKKLVYDTVNGNSVMGDRAVYDTAIERLKS